MAARPTLIVFARRPEMGAVKRRLARDIGPVAATAFYRHCLAGLLRRVGGDPRWRTVLAVTPDTARHARCWPAAMATWPQGPGDLGQRMARALAAAPPGPAVLIGSDIPAVGPRHVAEAFRRLGDHDAVFGPAADGGFWLVGLRRPDRARGLFAEVRWSGPHALADTVANLKGARVATAATLEDVDDGEAYGRWQTRQPRHSLGNTKYSPNQLSI